MSDFFIVNIVVKVAKAREMNSKKNVKEEVHLNCFYIIIKLVVHHCEKMPFVRGRLSQVTFYFSNSLAEPFIEDGAERGD